MKNKTSILRAFTLVELMTAIFIICVLIALIIPAVQNAREASRTATCASNLRAIGTALHQHAESLQKFPAGSGRKINESYLVHLLPYMEQSPLYNSINLHPRIFYDFADSNMTVALTQIQGFLCPSDLARSDIFASASSNYAGNFGMNVKGAFDSRPLGISEFTDGTSTTVGVSEWIVGPGTATSGTRLGAIFSLTKINDGSTSRDFEESCLLLPPAQSTVGIGYKGRWWLKGMAGITLYNHTLTPNEPSCTYADNNKFLAVTAASNHGHGAHSLMMDGSVKFIKKTIDRATWKALGTRSGQEIVQQY